MLSALRRHLDSWRLILAFGAIYFVSQIAIGLIVRPLGVDMLLVQTSLSAQHVRAIFAKWDAAGLIGTYVAHFRLDVIHPFWYAMFLAGVLAKGMNATGAPARCNGLVVLPFVAGACDMLENVVHLRFLTDRADITQSAVLVGNGAALVKWSVLAVSVLAAIVLSLSVNRKDGAAR